MEEKATGNVYAQIVHFLSRHPQVIATVVLLFVIVGIGGVVYVAPRIGNSKSANPSTNSLKFNLSDDPSQNQGEVQGASTQTYGPEEQSSAAPSSIPVSEASTPTSTAAVTVSFH